MAEPLVSVIIPAYNAAAHIVETVESALAQSHRATEVIVVDDGSRDDTVARLAPYVGRIRLLEQENRGGGAARDAGVAIASGDYVAFLDHDDLWQPEKLAVQLRVAARHPESGLIGCDGVQFQGDRILLRGLLGVELGPGGERTERFYRHLLLGNVLSTFGQVLIPRPVIERVGSFSQALDEPYDWDYWLRIARHHPFTLHADCLVSWRYVPTGRSGPLVERQLRWALMDLPVLDRELRTCPESERRFVRRARRRRLRLVSEAYRFAKEHDRALGRRFLRSFWRRAPFEPRVWPWLVAGHVPGRP